MPDSLVAALDSPGPPPPAISKRPSVPTSEQGQQDADGGDSSAVRHPGHTRQHDIGVAGHAEGEWQKGKSCNDTPSRKKRFAIFARPHDTVQRSRRHEEHDRQGHGQKREAVDYAGIDRQFLERADLNLVRELQKAPRGQREP